MKAHVHNNNNNNNNNMRAHEHVRFLGEEQALARRAECGWGSHQRASREGHTTTTATAIRQQQQQQLAEGQSRGPYLMHACDVLSSIRRSRWRVPCHVPGHVPRQRHPPAPPMLCLWCASHRRRKGATSRYHMLCHTVRAYEAHPEEMCAQRSALIAHVSMRGSFEGTAGGCGCPAGVSLVRVHV